MEAAILFVIKRWRKGGRDLPYFVLLLWQPAAPSTVLASRKGGPLKLKGRKNEKGEELEDAR